MDALTTFGDFLVLQELGHGGMGAVFIGYQCEFRRLVVIKTLFEQFAKEENWIKRFLREGDVYKKLNHPNIVKFYGSGEANGTHYIAMEYIKSRALDEVMKKDGKLAVNAAVRVMGYLADAVSHAHEKNIIHRDLKPQNIMYSADGVVKLLDFGIAYAEDDLIKTQEGTILGTFQYAAPEQNQGKKTDERSDLYALGAIWYEMLCGKRATAGNSLLEVTKAQITGGIIQPSVHNPEVPKGLEKMILKLLEKDPNNRYKNAKELIFDIQKFREDPKGFDPQKMFDDEITVKSYDKAKDAYIKKNFDLALDLLKQVAQAKPESAEIQSWLGKTYAAKNFKKPSMDAFKKALTFEPTNTQWMLDYANALYTLRAWDDAEVEIKKLLELEPDNMYAVNAAKKIADAKIKPPPLPGEAGPGGSGGTARPTGKSPVLEGGVKSSSGIYDRKPTQQTKALTPAQVADATGGEGKPSLVERLFWFLPFWKSGRKGKALFVLAIWLLVVGTIVLGVLWPKFDLDFSRTAAQVASPGLKSTLNAWHTQKLDQSIAAFLNGSGRWVTVLLALLVFVLMGIKGPRQANAGGANGAGGAQPSAASG
jgi:serine/threonine protein kinase